MNLSLPNAAGVVHVFIFPRLKGYLAFCLSFLEEFNRCMCSYFSLFIGAGNHDAVLTKIDKPFKENHLKYIGLEFRLRAKKKKNEI